MKNSSEIKQPFITAKDLEGMPVERAVGYVQGSYPTYPEKPTKPSIHILTSEDALKCASALESYEKEKEKFDLKLKSYNEHVSIANSALESYIKKMTGISEFPETVQNKLWSYAWDKGHSSGYVDVYYVLNEIVDLFEDVQFK